MQIENDLVVEIGDGAVIFEEPGLNDWTVIMAMDGKNVEEQADLLLPKVKGVRGLTYSDGSDVTVESLRAKKLSARFFFQLVKGWTRGVAASFKEEAEAKNESTGG